MRHTFDPIISNVFSARSAISVAVELEFGSGVWPIINDSVPFVAPTTPPDIGASMKWPALGVDFTACAIVREVDGSMVEQSMKRRGEFEGDCGAGKGDEGSRIDEKMDWM